MRATLPTPTVTHSYKELIVWQRSIELVTAAYQLTSKFPPEEKFGLTSQMRRAAISIPSNIAEGRSRGTRNDYVQFLRIAYSSGAELETQIIICKNLLHLDNDSYTQMDSLLEEVMKMLYVMIRQLNPRIKPS